MSMLRYLALSLIVTLFPAIALAGPYGFTFSIADNPAGGFATHDVPVFTLTNISSGALISSMSLTIGDTAYNFDSHTAASVTSNPAFTETSSPLIGNANTGAETDYLAFSFTGFTSGMDFSFAAELDKDSNDWSTVDYREILFNNGDAANSVITVGFMEGGAISSLSAMLPDFDTTGATSYSVTQSSATPIPGAVWLLGSGLVGLVGLRKRQRG